MTTPLEPNPAKCRVSFKRVPKRPDAKPGDHFASDPSRAHFHFTLTAPNGRRFSGYFTSSVGDPNPPSLADLLECLASDASSYLNARDVDDFAAELGYTKPREAIRAHAACKRIAEAFERMGLDPFADWRQATAEA